MHRAWQNYLLLWACCIQVITCDTPCKLGQRFYVDNNRNAICSVTGNNSYTCGNLQKVFLLLGNDSDNDTCSVITIAAGEHFITQPISFNRSIVLCGIGDKSKITFRDIINSSSTPANLDPIPVFTFRDTSYISINSLTFTNSPGFISIENITEVIITNTVFRLFVQGAVHVYNFHKLTVTGCIFDSNGPASFLKKDNFRGHSGGISVSLYNYTSPYLTHEIEIGDTIFVNNSAIPDQEAQRTTSEVLNNFIFTGRGGALGLFLSDTSSNITALVFNCTFERNFALTWGGGMYVLFDKLSNHTVTIEDSSFLLNHCDNGAGAICSARLGEQDQYSTIAIMRSNFTMNTANHGGATAIYLADQKGLTIFENCTFKKNSANDFGAAIYFNTIEVFRQFENSNPSKIINCKFVQNFGILSGCVTIVSVPVSFQGNNTFDNNFGSAVTVAGSILYIRGNLLFANQVATGIPQAAISITSFGQLLLHKHTRISFINNTGINFHSIGAAISVESQHVTNHLKKLFYNPLCFIIYEDPLIPPNNWTDVEMYFDGNNANEASAALIDSLDLCSWISTTSPYFNTSSVLRWKFIKFGKNANSFHDDKDNPSYYIQSSPVKLKLQNETVDVFPGQTFSINITITDELNKSLGGVVRLEGQLNTNRNSQSDFEFEPAVSVYQQEDDLIQTKILQISALENRTQTIIAAELFASDIAVGSMQIHIRDCPPGYLLTNTMIGERNLQVCECNSIGNSKILTCDQHEVLFVGSFWATNDSAELDSLYVYPCPMGYCQCELYSSKEYTCVHRYNNAKQDIQCSFGRKGILCGECRNSSLGVSALLNSCVTCSDASGLLISVLVVTDIIVFTLMLTALLNVKFPTWIYPCTFYIQILPYFTESFDEGFIVFRRYLYYIASALGFYFPYDFCLYSNMSALASYTIRFLPLLTAIIVCPTVLLIRKLLMKNSKFLLLKRNYKKPWYSVWLIILLVYTHAVHTAMSILNCPTIPLNNTRTGQWYVAGQVTCFTGGHTVLAVIALIVLLMATLLIPLLFFVFIYEYKNLELKVVTVGIKTHFKQGFSWWFTVEIGRRLLILLLIVAFPSNLFPSAQLLAVLLVIFLYIKPYNSTTANIAEVVLNINTIILGITRAIRSNGVQLISSVDEENVTSATFGMETIVTFNAGWWAFFYYIPIPVTIFLIIWSLIKFVRNKWCRRKKSEEIPSTDLERTHTVTMNPHNKFELALSRIGSLRLLSITRNKTLDIDTTPSKPVNTSTDSNCQ